MGKMIALRWQSFMKGQVEVFTCTGTRQEARPLKWTAKKENRHKKKCRPTLCANSLDAANAAGVRPVVVSAYRSADYQADLFRRRVQRVEAEEGLTGAEAEASAAFWVARPRTSEHEAAIAVDLADAAYQELDEAQEATATQRWLIDHCADYGFILRYPTDKSAITGIGYEPWHYRYVGKEAASAIAESGLCFEEWIEKYLDQGNA